MSVSQRLPVNYIRGMHIYNSYSALFLTYICRSDNFNKRFIKLYHCMYAHIHHCTIWSISYLLLLLQIHQVRQGHMPNQFQMRQLLLKLYDFHWSKSKVLHYREKKQKLILKMATRCHPETNFFFLFTTGMEKHKSADLLVVKLCIRLTYPHYRLQQGQSYFQRTK